MEQIELVAEQRTIIGKQTRALRRNGNIPLVVYGPGVEKMALQAEARAGRIRSVAPMHFFVNVMGMSVATFLTRPVIERLAPLLGATVDFGETWLEQRIDSIVDMAMNGIRIRREA